jgi:hypothetical protein
MSVSSCFHTASAMLTNPALGIAQSTSHFQLTIQKKFGKLRLMNSPQLHQIPLTEKTICDEQADRFDEFNQVNTVLANEAC